MRPYIQWCFAAFVLATTVVSHAAEEPIDLFDGKSLTGWDYFLVEPDVGMDEVWSVRDGLLVCKGEPMGYLCTKRDFTNFKLIVEWRWAPGKKPGNSGVLMRISGKPRALPRCLEAQLMHGNAGDFYGFQGFPLEGEPARTIQKNHPLGGALTGVKKFEGGEHEPGKWNRIEITLDGKNLSATINGKLVNQATGCEVVPGKIGFQSEGGAIHFRTIKLIPLHD